MLESGSRYCGDRHKVVGRKMGWLSSVKRGIMGSEPSGGKEGASEGLANVLEMEGERGAKWERERSFTEPCWAVSHIQSHLILLTVLAERYGSHIPPASSLLSSPFKLGKADSE